MNEQIIYRIIDKEAKSLLQVAQLLSVDKDQTAATLQEIYEEALRLLERYEEALRLLERAE